jgi:hypothetical protein
MLNWIHTVGKGIPPNRTNTLEQAEDKAWDYAYEMGLRGYTTNVSVTDTAIIVFSNRGHYSARKIFRYTPE